MFTRKQLAEMLISQYELKGKAYNNLVTLISQKKIWIIEDELRLALMNSRLQLEQSGNRFIIKYN